MLFKNVIRDFSKRVIQVGLLAVIVMLSSFIYVVMTYSVSAMKAPTEQYFEDYYQEDFNVVINNQVFGNDLSVISPENLDDVNTLSDLYHLDSNEFLGVIDNRINRFETTYDSVEIEARLQKDIILDFGDIQHTFRFLKDAENINLSYISEGRKPVSFNEIALTKFYAEAHDISIGDTIRLQDKDYVVTGFVFFPDYSLILFGNEFIINNKTRTLALLSDEGFNQLDAKLEVVFAGLFTEDVNKAQYIRDINLDYVLSVNLTENTMRSGAIYEELAGGEAMGILIALIIAVMAVFVVALMISRILNDHKGAIGILKALGYKNYEVTLPYLLFILLLALPGLLLGYYFGYLLAEPLKNIYVGIYILPDAPVTQDINVFIISIILPMIILLGLGYLVVSRLLQKPPVDLMNPKLVKNKPSTFKIEIPFIKKTKLLTRLKHAYIVRNLVRFSLFLVGVFTSVFLILMALSMVNIFDKAINLHYNQIDTNYIGYCDPYSGCGEESVSHDLVIELPNVMIDDKNALVVGLDADNLYYPLFEDGDNITDRLDEEGIIITKGMSLTTGLKAGDQVTMSYGSYELDVEILAIQDEYGTDKVYLNREALSLFLTGGLRTDYYNAVYSESELSGDYQYVLNIDDLIEQSKDMSNLGNVMSYVLIVSSVFIGVIVMMLISSLSLEAYFYDISLFKVIGYTDKEIQTVFINSYRLYTALVFFITIPVTLVSFYLITWYLSSQFGMVFPMSLGLMDYLIGLVLTMSIFYISVPIAKHKLNKHSLQQALMIYEV